MAIVDCSHPIKTGLQVYPDDPAVSVSEVAAMDPDGYRVSAIEFGTHSGTHIDAPSHTEPGGASLGAFPIETFRFDTQLLSLPGLPDRAAITVDDLPTPTDADLLVVATGWDAHWNTDRYRDHPYLTPEAAEWCADHDYHVGVDALNVDPTPSSNAADHEPSGFGAHHALLGTGHLIIENLTNLGGLPNRFTLNAYPLAVDADGAPIRAVASEA